MHIDPWGSSQYQDYSRLREQFGIEAFGPKEWQVFDEPHRLLRRGVVFGHRDFARIQDAVKGRDPWAVMTGLMPSGQMHLGHKMVIEQVIGYQKAGADVHVAVADFEAFAARGFTLEKAREIALDQYVHNYLALGLSEANGEVYFQTTRHRVKDLAHHFSLKVNWSQMQALYGFGGDTAMAHAMAPLVQAADILHVQQPELGGPRPVVVPVGVDQDPHLRLTRDIAQAWRRYRIFQEDADKGGEWVLAVKGEPKQRWLDVAEAVLDDLGIATRAGRKRLDKHGWIKLGSHLRGRDMRALDLGLARAEAKKGELGLVRPSATFHRFMTGLTGDKMSSSKPESSIFLTDEPKAAQKKLMASVTGGRATAQEQREQGADPTKCPVYELYLYHLADDDEHLQQVNDECRGGERLCGGCKKEAAGLLLEFLAEHKEKRDQVAHQVEAIVASD
ncbi:MAG: tryptophan--tRNA ligase [Thermoplasmatota archaeon]